MSWRGRLEQLAMVHLTLTMLATYGVGIGSPTYAFGLSLFCLWAAISGDGKVAFAFMIFNGFSIILDIAFFAAYGRGVQLLPGGFKFGLAMSVINLLLKPVTEFVVYKWFSELGGTYSLRDNAPAAHGGGPPSGYSSSDYGGSSMHDTPADHGHAKPVPGLDDLQAGGSGAGEYAEF
eukprot:PLAT3896.1.p2 GENE.PLAT3896.1~~PLAT3896.1.p2  ORF type:complete len:177 (-),score=76.58 PLAT3896.1:359-889(-)